MGISAPCTNSEESPVIFHTKAVLAATSCTDNTRVLGLTTSIDHLLLVDSDL